jgi:hypothetical protein
MPVVRSLPLRRADGGRAEGLNLLRVDATSPGTEARALRAAPSPFASTLPVPPGSSGRPSGSPSAAASPVVAESLLAEGRAGLSTDNSRLWAPGTMQSVRTPLRR